MCFAIAHMAAFLLACISEVTAMCVCLPLVLAITISLLLAIFPLQNWGCVHYRGRYGNSVHRGALLVLFWGYLDVNPDIMLISHNDWICSFISVVISGLHCTVLVVQCPHSPPALATKTLPFSLHNECTVNFGKGQPSRYCSCKTATPSVCE